MAPGELAAVSGRQPAYWEKTAIAGRSRGCASIRVLFCHVSIPNASCQPIKAQAVQPLLTNQLLEAESVVSPPLRTWTQGSSGVRSSSPVLLYVCISPDTENSCEVWPLLVM